MKQKVIDLCQEKYVGFGPTLAQEKLAKEDGMRFQKKPYANGSLNVGSGLTGPEGGFTEKKGHEKSVWRNGSN